MLSGETGNDTIWESWGMIRWLVCAREKLNCAKKNANSKWYFLSWPLGLNFHRLYRVWSLSSLSTSPFPPPLPHPLCVCLHDPMQLCELMTEGYQTPAQSQPLCSHSGQATRGSGGWAKWWHKPRTHTDTHIHTGCYVLFSDDYFLIGTFSVRSLKRLVYIKSKRKS